MRRKFTLGVKRRLKSLGALALSMTGIVMFLPSSLHAQSTTPTPYCLATHYYTTNNYNGDPCSAPLAKIKRVQISNLDHSANCPDGRGVYTYWNNVDAAIVSPGANYDVTLTTGVTANYYNEFGVWIDFNQDGDFNDANEFVFRGESYGSGASFTKNIMIPCNAVAGKTRMRVRNDYDYSGSPYNYTQGNACGNSVYGNQGYGETWDFDVQIGAVSSPSANFIVPDTVYTNSPTQFVNSNPTGYISHEWDVLQQGNAPDATTTNFGFTFPSAGTYQVKLTSTNCQGTDFETKQINVVNPTSAPQANFVVSENEVFYDGSVPIFIDFFDLSQYGATQWDWIITPDFLNGAPWIWSGGTNFSQNPQVFFYDVEKYNVCLAAGNSAGWDTICKTEYIKILDPSEGSSFENQMGTQGGSTLDSGVIYDSGGPDGNYGSNEFEMFTIAPCGAESVTLYFDAFNTQSSSDVLRIYDGPSSASPEITSISGGSIPSSVTASSGIMTLVFVSDNGTNLSGFAARWGSMQVNNGAPTASFIVPDTVYECSGGTEVLFKNSSTGVIEGQAEYDWIFDYDANVTYPGGYADLDDEENPSWTYSQTGTYDVRLVMRSCEGNDTFVKTLVVASSSNNPIPDFTVTDRILKVGGVATFTNNSVGGCSYKWDIFPTSFDYENGTSSTDPQIVVKFTSAGSYNIKLTVTNDNGTAIEEKTNYVDVIEYCKPIAAIPNVADVGITSFEVNDIKNASSPTSVAGYQDFTEDLSTDFVLGGTYSFTMLRGSKINNVDRKVWVDYNRDGDFNDANELVASQSGSSAIGYSGSFTVPGISDVVLGETRLRIGSALAGTNLPGCGPAQVGEYEDYTVNLIVDDKAPVITIIGADTTIEVNSVYVDPGATALDNIEGVIAVNTDNGVDESQAGIYYVTYTAVDGSGNQAAVMLRKVTVSEDLTAPTMTLNGGATILHSVLVPYADMGATATDMPSGSNLDAYIQVSGMVDINAIGDYTLTYTVTDGYGNMATENRIVQVRDTTAPMIVADMSYEVQLNQPFVLPVTVTDNFDQNVQLNVVSGSVNTGVVGEYEVVYSAMDASGNSAQSMTVTYKVNDYIAPTIHYLSGTKIVIVDVFDADWELDPKYEVSASDNYFASVSLTKNAGGFDINEIGVYTITYTAEDNAGNMSTFEREVHVVDREKPVVIANPITLDRWSSYDFLSEGVSVTDNYYAPSNFQAPFSNDCELRIARTTVDFNYPGIYEVVYVAIDGSGNESAQKTRIVEIKGAGEFTSITDINLADAIDVYPNPNNGEFTLEVNTVLNPVATIKIVNAIGAVVAEIDRDDIVNNKVSVDISKLNAGVYFIQVSNNDQVATKKVVVSK